MLPKQRMRRLIKHQVGMATIGNHDICPSRCGPRVGGRTGVRSAVRPVPVAAVVGRLSCVLGAVWCLLLVACEAGSPRVVAPSVLEIDGDGVAYGEFEGYLQRQLGVEAESFEGVVESRLFDQFIEERLVVRLARERGMEPSETDPRQALSFLLRDQRSAMLGDEALLSYYEEHRQRYERPAEVHLCQILVDSRQLAEEAYDALRGGDAFADVAARFSQGPKAQHGGDQGRLSQEDLPPDFVDVIFNLEPGEFSSIVVADYGMHIFQVKEFSPAAVRPFEAVVDEIRQEILRQQADEVVASFFAEARTRYNVRVLSPNLPFDYQGSFSYETNDSP